jgi:tRNA(Ile)-lysidine synthetase-like protein
LNITQPSIRMFSNMKKGFKYHSLLFNYNLYSCGIVNKIVPLGRNNWNNSKEIYNNCRRFSNVDWRQSCDGNEQENAPMKSIYIAPPTLIKQFPDIDMKQFPPLDVHAFSQQMTKAFREMLHNQQQDRLVIALGVSGGADSMALAILTSQWYNALPLELKNRIKLMAITVDHSKRKESKQEVIQVKKWMEERYNIPTSICTIEWNENEKINQETCRQKRMTCFLEEHKKHNFSMMLLGHHADDEAELFIYRVALSSGLQGLSGIPIVRAAYGYYLVRPFVAFRKNRLVATCINNNQKWIEDPTNYEDNEFRALIRQYLPKWEQYNVNVQDIKHAAESIKHLLTIMNPTIADFIQANVRFDKTVGTAAINLESLITRLPRTYAIKLIGTITQYIANNEYPTKYATLVTAYQSLKTVYETKNEKSFTFGHCWFIPKRNTIYVVKEPTKVTQPSTVVCRFEETIEFDRRYRITISQYNRWPKSKNRGTFQEWKVIRLQSNYSDREFIKICDSSFKERGKILNVETNVPKFDSDGLDTDKDEILKVRRYVERDWLTIERTCAPDLRKLLTQKLPFFARFGIPVIEDSKGILAIPLMDYKRQRDVYWECEFIGNPELINQYFR